MSDDELIAFASEFRGGILNGRSSEWMCAMVCWPLSTLLNMSGVENDPVESDLGHMNHIWLRLADGRALDPTADQFNTLFPDMRLPPVYLRQAAYYPRRYRGALPMNDTEALIERLREEAAYVGDMIGFTGSPSSTARAMLDAADALSSAHSQGRREGIEEAEKVAEGWLEHFIDMKIDHIDARSYASDAVADIRDAIRQLSEVSRG